MLRHPEWWLIAATSVAWLVILWSAVVSLGSFNRHHPGVAGQSGLLAAAGNWLVMIVAMMGPVLVPRVRRIAADLGRHCSGAIVQTLAGALLVWSAVGVVVVGLLTVAPVFDAADAPIGFTVVWLLVAVWQLSSSKRMALARCQAVPVPPAVGGSALGAGVAYSGWCVVTCGPAMVAMALTGHPLLLMIVLTIGLTAERVAPRPLRVTRRLAWWTVGAAAVSVVLTAVIA